MKFSACNVRKALLQLNTSKSKGPDGIPTIVLKSCAPEFAPFLNKSDLLSYRPIAITSLISKTMETIISKQLLAFLKTNSLLSSHQYSFLQARSTGGLLAYIVHASSSPQESYCESRAIFLDISKVFDRVWHNGLLAELPMFGLHSTLITWIASFLSGRSIESRIDGFLSRPHSITHSILRCASGLCNLCCSIYPLHK